MDYQLTLYTLSQVLRIIGFCIIAAIVYGIIHDQITIRISLEYFTIGHPPLFHDSSVTILALKWGILATWWVGLILGVALAISARCGTLKPVTAVQIIRPVSVLLIIMLCSAISMGLVGYLVGSMWSEAFAAWVPVLSRIQAEKHAAFLSAEFMHDTSYIVAFIGCSVLIGRIRDVRAGRLSTISLFQKTCKPSNHEDN